MALKTSLFVVRPSRKIPVATGAGWRGLPVALWTGLCSGKAECSRARRPCWQR